MGGLKDAPPARYKRRTPGELRIAELDAGDPPLQVEFEVPTSLLLAQAEAATQQSLAIIRESPALLTRYGLPEKALTDLELFAVARIVSAVESARLLWRDWNYAREGVDENRAPLNPEIIAELLADQQIRAAWLIHLDAASPLERAEGNASGASPNGSSAEAPNTADAAKSEAPPAPGAAEAGAGTSAPG